MNNGGGRCEAKQFWWMNYVMFVNVGFQCFEACVMNSQNQKCTSLQKNSMLLLLFLSIPHNSNES